MNNVQKVKVEWHNGRFQLTEPAKIEEVNSKALMLCAAAQCAGYTVMSILGKDDITPKSFEIEAKGWLNTPTLQPSSQYEKFEVTYRLECRNIDDQNAVSEAVLQAQTEKCGVIAMLRKVAPVGHHISVVSTDTTDL